MNELMKYRPELALCFFQRVYVYAIINKRYVGRDPDDLMNDPELTKYVKVRKFFIIRFDKLKDSNKKIIDFIKTDSGELETNGISWNTIFELDKIEDIIVRCKEPFPLTERDYRVILNTITPRMLRFYGTASKTSREVRKKT